MDTLLWILQAALGIGFLVFIHESGHFIAARMCGVRVHVFSLGFGPRVYGFRRKGCDYRLSLVPVGGYVRMEGELGEGETVLDTEGSLSHKSALQRIFVYSAGVAMNFLVAFILFPIVYFWGVPTIRPVIGAVTAGGPAWHAGIVPGSTIRSVNGVPIDSFDQVILEVALGRSPVRIEVDEPVADSPGETKTREFLVDSEFDATIGLPRLGIEAGQKIVWIDDESQQKRLGYEINVLPGSAAHDAGLRSGDLLTQVNDKPAEWARSRAWEDGQRPIGPQPVTVRVHPGAHEGRSPDLLASLESGIAITPRPIPGSERPILGIQSLPNVVHAARDTQAIRKLGLKPKDEILEVNGRPFVRPADLATALGDGNRVELLVRRSGKLEKLSSDVPGPELRSFPQSIAFEEGSTRIDVEGGSPADLAKLKAGDRIRRIGNTAVHDFFEIMKAVQGSGDGPIDVEVERNANEKVERFTARVNPTKRPYYTLGILTIENTKLVRAESVGEAIRLGVRESLKFIKQIVYILKKIALGDVPAKEHLGGPISIVTQTYQVAQTGFVQLLRFLGMLSLNLALVNLLPIPVLDGGNLFFVIVEAVKGSPVSDRVLGASQMVGVFLLVALMVWVTFHDIRRNFGVFF
jgi:regulator of sigma E protease